MSESSPDQREDVTSPPRDTARSVLESIGPPTWTDEEGITYEVAIESINRVVGAYSGLIGDEEDAASPDAGKIAEWRQARMEWARRRQALSPGDAAAVQAVRRETAELLREFAKRR